MHPHTARAIILNKVGQLLVMERQKTGQHYFSLPGGHVERGEAPEEAVVRELSEELGITVTVERLLYKNIDGLGNHQQIFLCRYTGGQPQLQANSIEATRRNTELYQPRWISWHELDGRQFYPEWLTAAFATDQAQQFTNTPRIL